MAAQRQHPAVVLVMAAQAQLRFKGFLRLNALLPLLACCGLVFGVHQLQPVLWSMSAGVLTPGQVAVRLPILAHPDHVRQFIQHSEVICARAGRHAGAVAR